MYHRQFVPAVLILALPLFVVLCSSHLWARTWTTKDGKYTVEADFVDLEDEKVILKKENGKIVKVPLNVLSDTDQGVAKAMKAKPLLKDENDSVRYWIAMALGHIGPPAKEAVPNLIVALTDRVNKYVSKDSSSGIRFALDHIEPSWHTRADVPVSVRKRWPGK